MAIKKLRGLLERSLAVIPVTVSGWLKPYGDDDEAGALVVHVIDADGNPVSFAGGAGGADRELVVVTFRVKTAFTGASIGDAITCTQILDVTDSPSTVSSIWRNQSTGADLGSAPDLAKLEIAGQPGLTDAQLRATALGTAIADGGNVAQGAVADAAWSGTGSGTVIALLKAIWSAFAGRTGEVQASPTANTVLGRLKDLLTGIVLAPGENHIGLVGGSTAIKSDTPAVTSGSAYASGNVIGGKLTFVNMARVAGGTGLIQMVSVQCKSSQTAPMDLILFHTDPTAQTFTDKTALALNAADFDKIIGVVHITDWTNLGTPSFAEATQLAMAYGVAAAQTTIYGVLVARGALTFASTSDIKPVVKALLD